MRALRIFSAVGLLFLALPNATAHAKCLENAFNTIDVLAIVEPDECTDKEIDSALEALKDFLQDSAKKVAEWKKENPKVTKFDVQISTLLSVVGAAKATRTELLLVQDFREKNPKKPEDR